MEEINKPVRDNLLLLFSVLNDVPVEYDWLLLSFLSQIMGVNFLLVNDRRGVSHIHHMLDPSLDVEAINGL
jgi:hypothetical protein